MDADLRGIQETTIHKQRIVEAIKAAESERLKRVGILAVAWKRPARELSLANLIAHLEPSSMKDADQLRAALNALTGLIERITESNADNRRIVERSLSLVDEMKKNVLGEAIPKSNTYTSQGQRQAQTSGARLFNKEA